MSVTLFTREEVINGIAASWNRGSIGSTANLEYMERLAEAGNRIMEANRLAWNATYGHKGDMAEPETPITGREIKRRLISGDTVTAKREGVWTLEGLRYNMVANNGQDFATAEVLDDLLGMFRALYSKAMLVIDSRRSA